MRMLFGALVALLLMQGPMYKPGQVLTVGNVVPATCTVGGVFINSSDGTISACTATDTWSTMAKTGQGGGGLPTGAIVMIDSGACPAGTAQVAEMNGVTPLGTLASNGNVGTTGGADAITPAGVNGTSVFTPQGTTAWPAAVPTHTGITASFVGNALGNHAHELPFQLAAATTFRPIASATFGVGTSRAATGTQTTTANTTSAAVALSQAVSAGTPAGAVNITSQGTVAWPAGTPTFQGSQGTVPAQTFVGTPFDNRSAFRRVIYCKAA